MRALITGIAGQDGWFLAEHLIQQGYEVFGTIRSIEPDHSAEVPDGVHMLVADMRSEADLIDAVVAAAPDEIYNLAAQSHVGESFRDPVLTAEVNALGVVKLLNAMQRYAPNARFVQAGTSELFAGAIAAPQNEATPLSPLNPYGAAKAHAHLAVQVFRQAGFFASNAILYNHESSRRPPSFVTRKITAAIPGLLTGRDTTLALGNLDAERDWGFAPDYMRGTHAVLRHAEPDDFILATGQSHSIRDLLDCAFGLVDLDWHDFVTIDPAFFRPVEPNRLVGDATKAHHRLGWNARQSFERMVQSMVAHDLAEAGIDLGCFPALASIPIDKG